MRSFTSVVHLVRARETIRSSLRSRREKETTSKRAHRSKENLEAYLKNSRHVEYDRFSCTPLPTRWAEDDGVWICECSHENRVRLYEGLHPFKYLKCESCNQTISRYSSHSNGVLSPLKGKITHSYQWKEPGPAPYCQVCYCCGLSHRATVCDGSVIFDGHACHCGCRSNVDWPKFYIGSAKPYKADPYGRSTDLYRRVLEKRLGFPLTVTT